MERSPVPTVTPTGITNMPGGVAQPYNVAGLYGIPLLYGQQPVQRARGGEMKMMEFPRKTGPINGPGTGTSDSIPAMLSDGEFVFTAKAVRNAGNGSRRKGAARMYKLMKALEGGAVKA
jgi:endo-1,4-beta-mannosidase